MDNFKSIFREYDIRGRVQAGELDEENFRRLALGFAYFLHNRGIDRVVVGHDNRKISPRFAQTAVEVLAEKGFTVYDIGLCITPAAYFAQYHLQAEGLMMITASHNPDGWCGCKLGNGLSQTLDSAEIRQLYQYCTAEKLWQGVVCKQGRVINYDIRSAYIEDILQRVKLPANSLRLVVDAGNGAAGIYAWELFQRLGVLTFQLNCDLDNTYPHYFPNPSNIAAREFLKRTVTTAGIEADLGISFDGDGDRLGVVDSRGNDIWSDRILMILARYFLRQYQGGTVVFDVKCTKALAETINKYGGRPVMWKTGHSHIKKKMRQEQAVLAGERSGHIFIGTDGRNYDDALLGAAMLLKILAESGKTLNEILEQFPCYATSAEIRIDCPDSEKYFFVERLKAYFLQNYPSENICLINGIRLELPNLGGWALVRASSNLPELVIIAEAENNEKLIVLQEFFKNELLKNGVTAAWQNCK